MLEQPYAWFAGLLMLLSTLLVTVAITAQSSALPGAPVAIDGCRTTPQFVAQLSTGANVELATDGREMGLTLRSLGADGAVYQHPTWDDAGFLGPLAYDRFGHVYVAPTPRLSLLDNPLHGAGTIWRVDTATGMLLPFVTLAGLAHERNPFGVLGLFYACDLDTLYAGSVLASTPRTQHGGVVAINLTNATQSVLLAGQDVLGVLVVRQGSGYMLYAGLARQPSVLALPLDAQGRPTGPSMPLLDLTTAGATPQERARKLRLIGDELVVELIPFTFSLQANASDVPPLRQVRWIWDTPTGQWVVPQ